MRKCACSRCFSTRHKYASAVSAVYGVSHYCAHRTNTHTPAWKTMEKESNWDCSYNEFFEPSFIHVRIERNQTRQMYIFNYFAWTFIVCVCAFYPSHVRCTSIDGPVCPISISKFKFVHFCLDSGSIVCNGIPLIVQLDSGSGSTVYRLSSKRWQ